MSTIKSSTEHLTLNADGSGKDIKFQANGVEKASISSAGAFTSTSIDATKLSGALPAIDGSALSGVGGMFKQYKVTSAPGQVSVTALRNTGATSGTYVGCEITMTPQDVNSWFKVHWDTIADDNGGDSNSGAGGVGIQLSVHTPSTGWVRKRDTGSHAFYFNAMGDEYFRPTMDTVVKAMNTELHTFRIYMDTHTGVYYRINSNISDDYRGNGWQNNHFEVTEINSPNFNSGNYTG
jgi:hypothetical protein